MRRSKLTSLSGQLNNRVVALGLMLLVATHSSPLLAPPTKTDKVNLGKISEQKLDKNRKSEKAKVKFGRAEAFIVVLEHRFLKEVEKAIRLLQRNYKRMPKNSAERLEMREQLIGLYLEAALAKSNKEMRDFDKKWDEWDRSGRKGREPKLNDSDSKNAWNTLAKEAGSMLREYPKSRNADNTMFNMGLAQTFLGREKDAARTFSQLIAKYPNSQKAGDAYFALGDYYFDRTDFRNAMTNYTNALKYKRSKAYGWALFKLGWCNYNLQRFSNALDFWKKTVTASAQSGSNAVSLKEEALRDMVYAFAELKQIEPAISYYKRNGGRQYIGRFLLLLGNTFINQGRYSSAVTTLKRYQTEVPLDEEAPNSQKEIVQLYYELGKIGLVWKELERFPILYGPKSSWGRAYATRNKRVYLEAQQLVKDQILYYSKITHKRGQNRDNQKLYAEALVGYGLFLKNYPKAKEVPEVYFNMADIEYFSKRYSRAGVLYLKLARMEKTRAVVYGADGKSENIHKKSAEYMLESYSLTYEPEYKELVKKKPDFNKPSMPLTRRAKDFISACRYYRKWYPKDVKRIKNCDAVIAEIYFRNQYKKESKQALWLLATRYPSSKEGTQAVEQLIPLYKGDDRALLAVTERLLKIPEYSKGKLGKKLRDLQEDLEVKGIEGMKPGLAKAKKLEQRYKANPKARLADRFIYNAAQNYLKAGDVGQAIAAYAIVVKSHPKSSGAQDSLLNLGQLNELRLELGAAANYFYQYYTSYPKDKKAIASLAKSCEIKSAVDPDAATGVCLAFAKKDAATAKSYFEAMLRDAFSNRNIGRLQKLVRTYVSKFKLNASEKVLAYSYIYNAANGRGAVANNAAASMQSIYRGAKGNISGEGLRSIGSIAFNGVDPGISTFEKMGLRGGTVNTLSASIQSKASVLEKMQKKYETVLATKDPFWGVAALYQMGYMREQLANDLKNPPEIKGATKSAVLKELTPQISALMSEAKGFYQKALQAVSKYSVYNEWAARARSGMARLSGKQISFEDIIVDPDFLGSQVPVSIVSSVKTSGGL